MNKVNEKLYNDLLELVDTNEAFYYVDHELDNSLYRVFTYRLASYKDFLAPSALEARGIMFEIEEDGEMIRIASRPMQKFFNYKENPFTENVDFTQTSHVMVKEDGSLISTFVHNNDLYLKSKTSLSSVQAKEATQWLNENTLLKSELKDIAFRGNTINMEWVSPTNRIVLDYNKPSLVILNVRCNNFGKYRDLSQLVSYPLIQKFSVLDEMEFIENIDDFVKSVPDKTDMEGYVFRFKDDSMLKMKTNWYFERHGAFDIQQNILRSMSSSNKLLFQLIIDETIDDVRVLFHDMSGILDKIDKITKHVLKKYNHMIKVSEDFHRENKELERIDYVNKANSQNDKFFSLYMALYDAKIPKYKQFAERNYKWFLSEED